MGLFSIPRAAVRCAEVGHHKAETFDGGKGGGGCGAHGGPIASWKNQFRAIPEKDPSLAPRPQIRSALNWWTASVWVVERCTGPRKSAGAVAADGAGLGAGWLRGSRFREGECGGRWHCGRGEAQLEGLLVPGYADGHGFIDGEVKGGVEEVLHAVDEMGSDLEELVAVLYAGGSCRAGLDDGRYFGASRIVSEVDSQPSGAEFAKPGMVAA